MKVRGLAAIDQRTVAARHLLDWRRDLLDDLGGDAAISAAQRALVDVAIRTRLYLDHVDAFLLEQPSLIVRRKRNRHHLMPLVEQRLRLADSLARVLGQLGLERRQKPPVDLTTYSSQHRPSAAAPQTEPTEGDPHDAHHDARDPDPDGHAGP